MDQSGSRHPGGGIGARERFAALAEIFTEIPDVTLPAPTRRGFGSSALRVDNRIFAMLSGDRLVLKLPPERVAALIEAGEGEPFDAGKGRPIKQWVAVPTDLHATWAPLSREALDFVRA